MYIITPTHATCTLTVKQVLFVREGVIMTVWVKKSVILFLCGLCLYCINESNKIMGIIIHCL